MLTDAEIAKLCRKAWSDDADTRHTLAPTDPVTRREIVAYRAAYAAGQAAASVPRGEPVAWYTPLIGNYAHVVWGKRPDTPMEWAPLYAAPAVAQESDEYSDLLRQDAAEFSSKLLRREPLAIEQAAQRIEYLSGVFKEQIDRIATERDSWRYRAETAEARFATAAAPAVAQEETK